ncbi:hypothetical protein [Bacillus proteolyticus]|uniref:hypothetical protein n=1 Tax=Bacillus proteolyticus TaxID=2026192 RepID=UPI003D01DFC7
MKLKKHILVTYSAECAENNHVDPNFTHLVYGDSGDNGKRIVRELTEGSFMFFNLNIGGKRYITAYFYIEKILQKGVHDSEIAALNVDAKVDDVVVFGSRSHSKILIAPLHLDRVLMERLTSLNADKAYFDEKIENGISELSAVNSKTKTPRILSEKDKEYLLSICKKRG